MTLAWNFETVCCFRVDVHMNKCIKIKTFLVLHWKFLLAQVSHGVDKQPKSKAKSKVTSMESAAI